MATSSNAPGTKGSPLRPPPAVKATSPDTPSNTLHWTCSPNRSAVLTFGYKFAAL